MKTEIGTFKHCTNCKLENNCCLSFDKIDSPILSEEEVMVIVRIKKEFTSLFNNYQNSYTIKLNENKCPFYNNGCSIYNIRPLDCRLFPYDIKNINNKYYLVLYNLDCNSNNVVEKVDEIIEKIKPFIHDFTDLNLNQRSNKLPYTIIKEITV